MNRSYGWSTHTPLEIAAFLRTPEQLFKGRRKAGTIIGVRSGKTADFQSAYVEGPMQSARWRC
jgi:hypothetical protein